MVIHCPRARPGARDGGPLPSCTARRQGWWSTALVHGQAPGVVVHCPRARAGARCGGPLPSCTARRQGWWSTALVHGQASGVVVHCPRARPGARGGGPQQFSSHGWCCRRTSTMPSDSLYSACQDRLFFFSVRNPVFPTYAHGCAVTVFFCMTSMSRSSAGWKSGQQSPGCVSIVPNPFP